MGRKRLPPFILCDICECNILLVENPIYSEVFMKNFCGLECYNIYQKSESRKEHPQTEGFEDIFK